MLVRAPRHEGIEPPPRAPAPRRILVAFDGSPGAWIALGRGIDIARGQRALLDVIAVLELPRWSLSLGMGLGMPVSLDGLHREVERELQQALAAARDEVPATVSVTTRILEGRAPKVLAEEATSGRYDLVVTGPRRLVPHLLAPWRRGVTRTLQHCRDVDVLVVRS